MPILLAVGVFIMANIKKYTTLSQDVYAHAGSIVEQAIGGVRTVYAFSLQQRFAQMYDQRLVGAEKSDAKRGVVFGLGAGGFFFALYSIYGTLAPLPPPFSLSKSIQVLRFGMVPAWLSKASSRAPM